MNKGIKTRKLKAFTPAEDNCQFAHSVRKFGRAEGAQYNYKAFTLAEILITLVIIGIIAALTIPSVVVKYQKEQTVTRLKKMYSQLSNVLNHNSVQYGGFSEINTQLSASEFIEKYFKPHLSIVGECDSITSCYGDKKPLAINRITALGLVKAVKLSEGSYLGISEITPGGVVFYYDINGLGEPNYSGRDIFYFYLINKNTLGNYSHFSPEMKTGLYPGGYGDSYKQFTVYSREQMVGNNQPRNCNKTATYVAARAGDACAALIMKDGWKISDDYPW